MVFKAKLIVDLTVRGVWACDGQNMLNEYWIVCHFFDGCFFQSIINEHCLIVSCFG